MRPNPVKEYLFWLVVTLGAVAVLGVLYDIAYGQVHHGDLCGCMRQYGHCGEWTQAIDRDMWISCCWVLNTERRCLDAEPGSTCQVRCDPVGAARLSYEFPSLETDHDGDGDVDLVDYAIVQIFARRAK